MECATTEPPGYLNSNGATPPGYIYSKGGVATAIVRWRAVLELRHLRSEPDLAGGVRLHGRR